MNLVDVNVLLYAINRSATQHDRARGWLLGALRGPATVGLAWLTVVGFVRVATNPRVLPNPLTTDQAFDLAEGWLAAPPCMMVEPTARHLSLCRGLLAESGSTGNLTSDAHLAALALEYGATMVTFDRDFERFGVPVFVP